MAGASNDPDDGDVGTEVIYRFANVEFDASCAELRVAGKLVAVQPRPLQLLAELLRHVNEVVTKDELFDTVWQGRHTVEHVLTNAIGRLRTALGNEGGARIVTVPRAGYRLIGPVQRVRSAAENYAAAAGGEIPGAAGYLLERALGGSRRANVWLATNARLNQTHVFKFASEGAQLLSLKREYTLYRVLLASLGSRDDIATVVDSNFVSRPFYLKCAFGGANALEWADEGHLAKASTAERIDLFLGIARAVAAAHSVGVLHKDLKPSNVLIEPTGSGWHVRLTDFGSGRLLDPRQLDALGVTALGLTQTQDATSESRSGTLLYLAPEVIGGHAPTIQSDLFALGIILYQLIAGDFSRPMSTGWERDISDALLAEDVAAATEGQPPKRLASASELIERLQSLEVRHRERAEREAAAKVAAAERAELMRRRARRPWALGAFGALILGLAAALGFYVRSQQALADARQQAGRAQSINDFLTDDVLESADATQLTDGQPATMAEVLRRASAAASERFRGQPRTEASVRLQLGDVFSNLGDPSATEHEYVRAVALLSPLARPDDVQLLIARLKLARLMAVRTRLDESHAQLDLAEQALTPALLGNNPDLEIAAQSARRDYLGARQRNLQALAPTERVVVLADESTGGTQRQRTIRRFAARSSLAEAYLRVGRLKDTEGLLAALLCPPYDADKIGDVRIQRARIRLAQVRLALGQAGNAEDELIAARDALLKRLGKNDLNAALANMELGNLYLQRAEFERATDAFAAAHATYQASEGPANTNTRISLLNLAITNVLAGRAAAALPVLARERPQFVVDAGAEDNPVVQAIDFYRARAYNDLQRGREALPLLASLSAQKLSEAEHALDWEFRLQAERGRALAATGERQRGEMLLRSAIDSMVALKSPEWLVMGYRSQLTRMASSKR